MQGVTSFEANMALVLVDTVRDIQRSGATHTACDEQPKNAYN